jgi:hypothetical protein
MGKQGDVELMVGWEDVEISKDCHDGWLRIF